LCDEVTKYCQYLLCDAFENVQNMKTDRILKMG
jgi:hypothetical protein